jgi:hypothetical protein
MMVSKLITDIYYVNIRYKLMHGEKLFMVISSHDEDNDKIDGYYFIYTNH